MQSLGPAFGALTVKIQNSIGLLESRQSILKTRFKQYDELRDQLKLNSLLFEEKNMTVNLGDGWFVNQSINGTIAFLDRRLSAFEVELKDVNFKLVSARNAIEDLSRLEQSNVPLEPADTTENGPLFDGTDESLPMMDIREELDEDGNVISSTVGPQQKDHELKAFAEKHLSRAIMQRESEVKKAKAERSRTEEVKEDPASVLEGPAGAQSKNQLQTMSSKTSPTKAKDELNNKNECLISKQTAGHKKKGPSKDEPSSRAHGAPFSESLTGKNSLYNRSVATQIFWNWK